MFIIQQDDIVKTNIPTKYRGSDEKHILHDSINSVKPFPSNMESINEINKLINTMRKTGREGIYPDNKNKKFIILDVDEDNIIRKTYSLKEWFNKSINKLEW